MIKKATTRDRDYARPYLLWLAGFALCFILIISSTRILGQSYSYEEAVLDDYMSIGNNVQTAMVYRGYNPDTQLSRLDFYLKESTSTNALTNMTYWAEAKYITGDDPLEVNLTRVNDNYAVITIQGLPSGFSVLAVTIYPEYIYPELEAADNLGGKSLKIYVYEREEIIDQELSAGDLTAYQQDYIDVEIRFLEAEIAALKDENLTHQLAISQAREMIEKLENELVFQTQAEQIQTQSSIEKYESSINSYEQAIENALEEIAVLEEKIAFQEAKRASYS